MKGIFKAILVVIGLLFLVPLVRLLISVISWTLGSLGWCGGIDPWFLLTIVFVAIFLFFMIKLIND